MEGLIKPSPPAIEQVREVLAAFGTRHSQQIARIDIFGSVAFGEAGPGSDVDVLVTFVPGRRPEGWDYFGAFSDYQRELEELLGVPVDVLDRAAVEKDPNPYRREGILGPAQLVYGSPASVRPTR